MHISHQNLFWGFKLVLENLEPIKTEFRLSNNSLYFKLGIIN